jgi:hypothetical protein
MTAQTNKGVTEQMITRATLFAVGLTAFAFGCSTEQTPAEEQQEIIDNLVQAGFPADDIMVAEGKVYVGRDAHVTLEASREMLVPVDAGEEQYRTTNLMSGKTKVCINPTSAFSGTSGFSSALSAAVNAYNALPLVFDFAVGPTTGCSANISARTTSGAGGSAGFPSGGNPYSIINIGTGLTAYSAGVKKHVIMHELGHCIGFRHSDYYNRSISCGGAASNEGSAGVGAILIPGTPSSATNGGSVMNSCFSSSSTGNWTSSDQTALNYLY